MIPVVSVVGRKNAGKTTLVEGLVRVLVARGYRVGTIKHDAHDFEIDHEGKDSWRHAQAGAQTVVIASASKVAMVKKVADPPQLWDLVATYFGESDLVVAEGYRQDARHRIEVVRGAVSATRLYSEDEVVAYVSDVELDVTAPCFAPGEVTAVADLVQQHFLAGAETRSDARPQWR